VGWNAKPGFLEAFSGIQHALLHGMHTFSLPYPGTLAVSQQPTAETILLVEDDDNLRSLLRNFLIKKGYTVLDAGFNSSAFLMAGRYDRPIHLMITDLMMPGTTGHDLANRLKAWRPDMKVLYISGQSRSYIDRKGLLEDGDAFLQKPFDPNVLLEAARNLLATDSKLLKDPKNHKAPPIQSNHGSLHGIDSFLACVKNFLRLH